MAQAEQQADNDAQTQSRLLTKHEVAAAEKTARLRSENDPLRRQKLGEEVKFEQYAQEYVDYFYKALIQRERPTAVPTVADVLKQSETVATARVNLDEGKLTRAQFDQILGNAEKAMSGPQVDLPSRRVPK